MKFRSYIFSKKAYPEMFHTWFTSIIMIVAIVWIFADASIIPAIIVAVFCLSTFIASWIQAYSRYLRNRG